MDGDQQTMWNSTVFWCQESIKNSQLEQIADYSSEKRQASERTEQSFAMKELLKLAGL
jgi:hypothetical protein